MGDLVTDEDLGMILGPIPPRTDRHRLAGKVLVDGTGAKRIVVAFKRATFEHVGITTSDIDGNWEMWGLEEFPEKSLFVVAFDNTETFNAEIADYISQVATA